MRFLIVTALAAAYLVAPSLACHEGTIYCYESLNGYDKTKADGQALKWQEAENAKNSKYEDLIKDVSYFPQDFRYLCINSEGTFGFKGSARPQTVELVDRCRYGCEKKRFRDDECSDKADPKKDIFNREGASQDAPENKPLDMNKATTMKKDKTVDHNKKQWTNF